MPANLYTNLINYIMSLYPDTLFHFTQKDSLYQILTSTFKVSYAREHIVGPTKEKKFAVPMVSFCDLKLSELKDFIKSGYGTFGLGMTKEWANRNRLNPVMYMNRHCELVDDLIAAVNELFAFMEELKDGDQYDRLAPHYQNIINYYRYIKPYEGELNRKGELIDENYRFADEREWRYVPPISNQDIRPLVGIDEIDTDAKKEAFNHAVRNIRIPFEPDDIKYLIVEKEDDINPLIDHLRDVKDKFPPDMLNRLASRILTIEQINKDI